MLFARRLKRGITDARRKAVFSEFDQQISTLLDGVAPSVSKSLVHVPGYDK
jgi:hypothetical protein